MQSEVLFFHRAGTLNTELWGKDSDVRGGAAPRFFKRNGDEQLPPEAFIDVLMKVTEGVCCVGCKHTHLMIEGKIQTRSWDDKESGQKKFRTEILINDLTLLGGGQGKENGNGNPPETAGRSSGAGNSNNNNGGGYSHQQDYGDQGITGDDIPF